MSLWSSWDDKDVHVELLAYDVWSSEDDKTGFLSVEVDNFDLIFVRKRQISMPTVQISTIKRKNDKRGKVKK